MMRRRRLLGAASAATLAALAAGCSRPGPLRLGFIGALTTRAADVGESGRNGVMLALEQRNQAGGVAGREVQLVIEDDGQNATQAEAAMRRLLAGPVDAVIGPFTSAMAAAVVPLANQAGIVLVSPTVTGLDFYGRDDHFFRIHRTTRDNAGDYAQRLLQRGQRSVAVAYDLGNRNFSESWLAEFRRAYTDGGGQLRLALPFESRADSAFQQLAGQLLASKADGLLFIANAVDVARLGQRARQLAPQVPLAAAEWAATEALIELAGRALDGLLILQPYDRDSTAPRYQQFRQAYLARFRLEPGYASVAAHDAATVLFEAFERRQGNETLKAALLARGPFTGLQQAITFDRNGDTQRLVVFAELRDGQFALLR